MQSLVSVVITTCKREPNIVKRAVLSVLNQRFSNFELIIIDDSPSDYPYRESVRNGVLAFNDPRIIYLPNPENIGACASRNKGLQKASGNYIAFLDDDDEWLPQKLEKQVGKMNSVDQDTALIYCGSITIKDGRPLPKPKASSQFIAGNVYPQLIVKNFIGSTSFPLIRRRCLTEIGGFDPLMQSAQDRDVWLRLAQKYRVDFVPEPLVKYYFHNGEQISSNPSRRIAGWERLLEKNMDYLQKNRKALWFCTIRLAPVYIWNGNYRKAFTAYLKSVRMWPLNLSGNIKHLYQMFRYAAVRFVHKYHHKI